MYNENERRTSVSSEQIGPFSPFQSLTPSSTSSEYELPEVEEKVKHDRDLEILQQIEEERAHLESLRLVQMAEAEKVLEQQRSIAIEQKRLEQERLALEQQRAQEAQALANVAAAARSFGF